MEANEAQELEEQSEEASNSKAMRPVALTMSILAVLVAVVSMLGERAHTDAIIEKTATSDTWNLYQAKKNRAYNTELAKFQLSVTKPADEASAKKIEEKIKEYSDHLAKWDKDTEQASEEAKQTDEKFEHAEILGNRFNLAQVLLEIALVVTSITLLTHRKAYWYLGFLFAIGGLISALSSLLT